MFVRRSFGVVSNNVASRAVSFVGYFCSVGHVVLMGWLFLKGDGDTRSSWIQEAEERFEGGQGANLAHDLLTACDRFSFKTIEEE